MFLMLYFDKAQMTEEAQSELHGNVRVVGDIPEIDIHLALEYGKDDIIAGIGFDFLNPICI